MLPVAVVICHHNRPGVLRPLLDSLRAQTCAADLRLYVVDNGSTDGSSAEALADDVTVLATGRNLGGTGGFTYGLAEVVRRGGFGAVLLLDNDVTLAPDAVAHLAAVLAKKPRAGMVTGTVLFAHDPELIQETGALLLPRTGWLLPRFHRRYDDGTYVDTVAVDYAGACMLMVRAETLADIGQLDDDYFLYWDDIDWCCRAREQGWEVIAAPAARAWHAGGLNVRRTTAYHYYKLRNRVRFWRRWAGSGICGGDECASWPGIIAAIGHEVATTMAVTRAQGRAAIADTLLDALRDAAAGIGGPAPDGRIRDVAAGPPPPVLRSPVAILDWETDDETRYQTVFRATELLRQWQPDADIRFLTSSPPLHDITLLLKRRQVAQSQRADISYGTVVALCDHAWCNRDNGMAQQVAPEKVLWLDRHSNHARGTQPLLAAPPDAELQSILARLTEL